MTAGEDDPRLLMGRALRELQRAEQRIRELEQPHAAPIAIVGAACRLPKDLDSPAALWEFLQQGGDGTGPIPRDRWDIERFHDPRPGQPGRIAARRAACLGDIQGFDAAFFGIAPREAELMDPQQRLLLETAWHCFEDAGLPIDSVRGRAVGVFVGISTIDYAYHLVQNVEPDAVTGHCGTGTTHSVAAGRIAYSFDLRGPCLAIDTACSSSLVALHLASQSLRAGECEYALIAGINVLLSPLTGAAFSHARMLAPDGRCKTFAADADGYARGEGCVALLLARSNQTAARGLRARAEILGSAIGHDGRSAGLTVPSGDAQIAVIQQALQQARLPAAAIDVVEAHGTGTPLGDPIELRALASVFQSDRPADRPLLVAAVKTNLGHTEAAAGLLSVLKAVLQLEHGVVAPHLHCEVPTPHVPWPQWPLRVPREAMPWPHDGVRHMGVSAFGFSGTNAHVVLRSSAPAAAPPSTRPALEIALPLAAADAGALRALARRCAAQLEDGTVETALELAVAQGHGRAYLPLRCVVLARTVPTLLQALATVTPMAIAGEAPAPLPELARAWIDGSPDGLRAWLRATGRTAGAAPLYPFQHRRHWIERREPEPRAQLLTVATAPYAPARPQEPRSCDCTGSLDTPRRQALQAIGALAKDAALAERCVYVAEPGPPARLPEQLAAAVHWLQAKVALSAAPELVVLVDGRPEHAPLALALRAMVRAVNAELPRPRLCWIAALPAALPATVAQTLATAAPGDELELGAAGVRAVRFAAAPLPVGDAGVPFATGAAWLITGGTGALGGLVAEFLLTRGASHVWLLGRRGAPPPPQSVQSAAARTGAHIHLVAGDVTDAQGVTALVQRIAAGGVPLRGIVHLAGVVSAALLAEVDDAALTAQLLPKALGAWHLHAATQAHPLSHFVCCSSAVAWLGNQGQLAYAAANGALEGLCQLRRATSLPAQSIAFGPLRDGGMARDAAVDGRMLAHGVRPLVRATVFAALDALLRGEATSIACVDIDWQRLASVHGELPPRLRALAPPNAAPAGPPARPLADADLPVAIAAEAAAVLGQTTVAVDAPLPLLGLDSLLAVDLQQRLHQRLGLELPLAVLLAGGDCRALATAARTNPATAGSRPAPAAADLRGFVAGLDDAEVAAMLRPTTPPAAEP